MLRREDWDARYAERELLWSAEPNRFVAEEAAGLAPGRALDLACGEGRNALWLADRGWRVTGVDFSPVAIAKAREAAALRGVAVEWLEADVRAWAPPPRAFDLVAMAYLQLPDDELGPVITRAAEAVAPGGTFLLVSHDVANLEEGHGGPSRPEVLTTAEGVVAHLGGLDVERAGRVPRDVEGAPRPAIDTLVRARRPA